MFGGFAILRCNTKVLPKWKKDPENITGMQHALWKECRAYLTYIKENYLDNDAVSWSLDSTNFQQGAMSRIFWGKSISLREYSKMLSL